jgi:Polysaccharide biosynthesis enzyme WcbI
MQVIISSNCTTRGYYNAVAALFPHWQVKAAGVRESERWIQTGEKPEFVEYINHCDLYIGLPVDGRMIGAELNPNAERIIIPELYFRGLHPDVARLRDFRGPFTISDPHTQVSTIMLGAKAIGMSVNDTQELFCEDIYQRLGFFDLYNIEKGRLIASFAEREICIKDVFSDWEARGDFFYICHHPRKFVLFDIVRCALRGRHLSEEAFRRSEEYREVQVDTLNSTEVWPVYPEIARHLGFQGDLVWLKSRSESPREMCLREVIEKTFESLESTDSSWKNAPFVSECATLLEGGARSKA